MWKVADSLSKILVDEILEFCPIETWKSFDGRRVLALSFESKMSGKYVHSASLNKKEV